MGNIAAPVSALIARIIHHRDTGYTPPGSAEVMKLLGGVRFYENPTARADDDEDLPYLTMNIPKFEEVGQGGKNQAQLANIEITFDFASNKKWGIAHATELGFMNLSERVIAAITRNNLGQPDRWLGQTISNQIAIAVSDGVASDQSITASAVVKLQSKAYQ